MFEETEKDYGLTRINAERVDNFRQSRSARRLGQLFYVKLFVAFRVEKKLKYFFNIKVNIIKLYASIGLFDQTSISRFADLLIC